VWSYALNLSAQNGRQIKRQQTQLQLETSMFRNALKHMTKTISEDIPSPPMDSFFIKRGCAQM